MDVNFIGKLGTLEVQNALNKKAELAITKGSTSDPSQRKQVAQEFTSFLYLEVLKAMRAALPPGGLFEEDSNARDIYTSMMDGEIARALANRDTTGLTKIVEKALEKSALKKETQDTPEAAGPGTVSFIDGLRRESMPGSSIFHDNVDVAVPVGTPVAAPTRGNMAFRGPAARYGIWSK